MADTTPDVGKIEPCHFDIGERVRINCGHLQDFEGIVTSKHEAKPGRFLYDVHVPEVEETRGYQFYDLDKLEPRGPSARATLERIQPLNDPETSALLREVIEVTHPSEPQEEQKPLVWEGVAGWMPRSRALALYCDQGEDAEILKRFDAKGTERLVRVTIEVLT